MSSLAEELDQAHENLKSAMSKPFTMRLTQPPLEIEIKGVRLVWLFGMCETGTLRLGEMIRVSGADKPDVITKPTCLMQTTAPNELLYPSSQEVVIVVEGLSVEQFGVNMIVTRFDEETG